MLIHDADDGTGTSTGIGTCSLLLSTPVLLYLATIPDLPFPAPAASQEVRERMRADLRRGGTYRARLEITHPRLRGLMGLRPGGSLASMLSCLHAGS